MSEFNLPASWAAPNLSEIADVSSGIGFPKEYQGEPNGDLGFFKVGDISTAVLRNNGLLEHAQHFVSHKVAKTLKAKPIKRGATVFAKIGEAIRLNRRAFVNQECLVDNNVMAVKAALYEQDRYVYFFLRTIDFSEQARATTVPSLRKGDVEALKIPLAPLAEQKRIADKLDSVLARVDACRERLNRVPLILKRFRQSVLAAAISGQLTAEYAESQVSSWNICTFNELYADARTGLDRRSSEQGEDRKFAYFKMNNISNDGKIINLAIARVDASEEEIARYSLKNGDFLFNTRNSVELVGKTCVYESGLFQDDVVLCNNNILRIRFKPGISPKFINISFCSPLVRMKLEELKSATTSVAAIYQSKLNNLTLSLPDYSLQLEIVSRVQTLFAFADRLEARLATASTAAERLTPALLAKAFRGELVPQDPNDEPAAELLKRLAAAREPAAKGKRGGKSSSTVAG